MVHITLSDAVRLLELALKHPDDTLLAGIVTRALAAAHIAVHTIVQQAMEVAEPTVWAVRRFAESRAQVGDFETLKLLIRHRSEDVRRHVSRLFTRYGSEAHQAILREACLAEMTDSVRSDLQSALAALQQQGDAERPERADSLNLDDELCLRLALGHGPVASDVAALVKIAAGNSELFGSLSARALAAYQNNIIEPLREAIAHIEVPKAMTRVAKLLLQKDQEAALEGLTSCSDDVLHLDRELLQALVGTRDPRAAVVIVRGIATAQDRSDPRRALATMGMVGYLALLHAYRNDERIRRSEGLLLWKLGRELSIEPLVEALQDTRSRETQESAAQGLEEQHYSARQPLYRALRTSNVSSRPAVIDLLIAVNDPDIMGYLLRIATAGDVAEGALAIRKLSNVNSPEARASIEHASKSESSELRAAAASAMGSSPDWTSKDELRILSSLARDENEQVWRTAIDVLADKNQIIGDRITTAGTTEALIALLDDGNPVKRDVVFTVLARMGDAATLAIAVRNQKFMSRNAARLSKILLGLDVRFSGEPEGWWRHRGAARHGPTEAVNLDGELRNPLTRIDRDTYFSVTSAEVAAPGTSLLMDVWAHTKGRRDEVLRWANESLRGVPLYIRSVGPAKAARGCHLGIRLVVSSLRYRAFSQMLWSGGVSNCSFLVPIPETASTGVHPGKVDVYVARLLIARLHFDIRVGETSITPGLPAQREERVKSAFASYASEDRSDVLGRVQGMQKIVPDLDIFLDVISLRSGEDWRNRIQSEISSRDVFYLFWSGFAKQSSFVDHEWRTALRVKGIDCIDPVPLVSPSKAPPPPELARLHFGDWTVAIQSSP